MRVFVPGHVTFFFSPRPEEGGSIGVGACLDKGVIMEAHRGKKRGDLSGIGREVVYYVSKELEGEVHFSGRAQLPFKHGLGMSGALYLSVLLSKSIELGLGKTIEDIGEIAHSLELRRGTGLGDVIAQIRGGIDIRLKAGGPKTGKIEKLLPRKNYRVSIAPLGELETKEVLRSEKVLSRFRSVGEKLLREFLESERDLELAVELSKYFFEKTKLGKLMEMSDEFHRLGDSLDEKGVTWGISMLGKTIVSISRSGIERRVIRKTISRYVKPIECRIDPCGARVI